MKKILKDGRIEKKQNHTYIMTCPSCGCEFTFNFEDVKSIEKTPNGRITIDCPFCKDEISTRRGLLVIAPAPRSEMELRADAMILRSRTGRNVQSCLAALYANDGDIEKAQEFLKTH